MLADTCLIYRMRTNTAICTSVVECHIGYVVIIIIMIQCTGAGQKYGATCHSSQWMPCLQNSGMGNCTYDFKVCLINPIQYYCSM